MRVVCYCHLTSEVIQIGVGHAWPECAVAATETPRLLVCLLKHVLRRPVRADQRLAMRNVV